MPTASSECTLILGSTGSRQAHRLSVKHTFGTRTHIDTRKFYTRTHEYV